MYCNILLQYMRLLQCHIWCNLHCALQLQGSVYLQGYDTDDDLSMGRVSDFSVEPSQESNPGAFPDQTLNPTYYHLCSSKLESLVNISDESDTFCCWLHLVKLSVQRLSTNVFCRASSKRRRDAAHTAECSR